MSKYDDLYNQELDKRSQELYDKNYNELEFSEKNNVNQYINDIIYPQWKPIVIDGINTGYQISNAGGVKNPKGFIISSYIADKNKYHYTSITINGHQYRKTIHRLVAIAFIPNPENKPEVNHINGKKWLNWVGNLEWNTRQENATNAVKDGLMLRGSDQPIAIYTEKDVRKVCKLIEKGLGHKEISEKLNVSESFVSGIMYRGEWKHISKDYKIPKPKEYANEEIIHNICKELSTGEKQNIIAKKLNVDWILVNTVKSGKAWRNISNQYNIPGLEKVEVKEKKSTQIYKLFDDGILETNVIIDKLGLPDSKGIKKYIAKLRRVYTLKQVETSSTIDQL